MLESDTVTRTPLRPMYNKLFTKILDSSIWLEPVTTRIVWITLLAAMDEDGYAHFSAIENLANRARVTVTECNAAVAALMSPDPNSADPEFEGRRIERVNGGFMILNAVKYRGIFSNATRREQTRLRVKRFREKQASNADVTQCNAQPQNVTLPYDYASESPSTSVSKEKGSGKEEFELEHDVTATAVEEIYELYPHKVGKPRALRAIRNALKTHTKDFLKTKTASYAEAVRGTDTLLPNPATWFNDERFNDDPSTWARQNGKPVVKANYERTEREGIF